MNEKKPQVCDAPELPFPGVNFCGSLSGGALSSSENAHD